MSSLGEWREGEEEQWVGRREVAGGEVGWAEEVGRLGAAGMGWEGDWGWREGQQQCVHR